LSDTYLPTEPENYVSLTVTSPIQDVFLETAASCQYSSVLTPAT